MKQTYEQIVDDVKVDAESGEIIAHEQTREIRSIINQKIPNEPDYIKIYKYVNTLFAFKGIKTSLTPFIIEIANHMTYANEGQIVCLNGITKQLISENLGVTTKRLDQVISELRKADILRKIQNGVYGVNPYICACGSWSDVRKLQAHYDFMSDEMTTVADVKNKISGKEIRHVITNSKNQIPGQMNMFDLPQIEDRKTAPKNNFNNYPQNSYDFKELEEKLLDN